MNDCLGIDGNKEERMKSPTIPVHKWKERGCGQYHDTAVVRPSHRLYHHVSLAYFFSLLRISRRIPNCTLLQHSLP